MENETLTETPTETIQEPVQTGSNDDFKANVYDKILNGEKPVLEPEPTVEPEEEPAPETTETAKEEPETNKDDLWDEAIARAAQAGFTPEEARKFGSPEVLALALDKISAAKSGDAEETPPSTMPKGLAEMLKTLDEMGEVPDDFDDTYRERDGKYKGVIKSMLTELATAQQFIQSQQQNMFLQQFDTAVDVLGETKLFGEGPILGLDAKSTEAPTGKSSTTSSATSWTSSA